ncbi:MAG: radical SAM protein [Pseudomonadota bacterium]
MDTACSPISTSRANASSPPSSERAQRTGTSPQSAFQSAFQPALPLHVVFILDQRCNLNCIHCSSAASRGGDPGFDTASALRVVDELAEAGVLDVAFSGGEPLLRRDLPQLIRAARAHGMSVGTSTNGWPLTEAKAAILRDAGLNRLQVSLDGDAQTHDRIRGAGSFARAVRAIRRSRAAGLRTHVCFTAMRSNADQLDAVIDIALGAGAHGFNLSQFVPTGRGSEAEDLDGAASRTLLETWMRARRAHPDAYFALHSAGLVDLDPTLGAQFGGCQAGLSIACIDSRGNVLPCVMFPLTLGNLHARPLREIWRDSPVLQALRARELGGICGGCPHRRGCGGCRAAAWARTGDFLASDPRCWRQDGAGGHRGP